jgi:hypothetical protein
MRARRVSTPCRDPVALTDPSLPRNAQGAAQRVRRATMPLMVPEVGLIAKSGDLIQCRLRPLSESNRPRRHGMAGDYGGSRLRLIQLTCLPLIRKVRMRSWCGCGAGAAAGDYAIVAGGGRAPHGRWSSSTAGCGCWVQAFRTSSAESEDGQQRDHGWSDRGPGCTRRLVRMGRSHDCNGHNRVLPARQPNTVRNFSMLRATLQPSSRRSGLYAQGHATAE